MYLSLPVPADQAMTRTIEVVVDQREHTPVKHRVKV